MRRGTFALLFSTGCFLLLMTGLAMAAASGITTALDAWQGPKEAILVKNGGSAPGLSAEMLPWLEVLLARGFAVRTDADALTGAEGVILEIQTSGAGPLAVLRRGNDGAILALEKLFRGQGGPKTVGVLATAPVANSPPLQGVIPASPLLLDMKPRSLVDLGSEGDKIRVALLAKNGVTVLTLSGGKMEKSDLVSAPGSGWRPLFLSRMKVRGTPEVLLAAVWAEDIHSIYEGTNSRIWSQPLLWDGAVLQTSGAPTAGYARLGGDRAGAIQQRGTFSLYDGPVLPFPPSAQRDPLFWGQRGLFALTPLDADLGLAWVEPGRLALVNLLSGDLVPGGALLEDFGPFAGAEVAVRIEEPGYRSGFAKEDRVLEKYWSLPPRTVKGVDKSVVTIRRGRREGMAFIGQAQGDDVLVRVEYLEAGLRAEHSFAPIPMFILDFAPIGDDQTAFLLLLNEKADGGGQAYLQLQWEGP
ncbi:hypothetical protein DSOUD_0033 [Desulfuromonas soudanensis]|uniref:Uncharacterized protein n=1 Tax=Desulfuromonas soudanensis TaxID=1603606 RepID=A0A0M4CYH7_9BACT|nr:hypothetical protein [Desulfuromonas soudanensis]ALC14834.1 hypothetical protein DSOUD_0033 [Desulfuromonas soudanensis]